MINLRQSMDEHWFLMKDLFFAVRRLKTVTDELSNAKSNLNWRIELQGQAKLLVQFDELDKKVDGVLYTAEQSRMRKHFLYALCFSELESSTREFRTCVKSYRRLITDDSNSVEEQLAAYIRNNAGSNDDLDPALESAGIESWLRKDNSGVG
jgi:hypothetical protein